MSNIKNEQRFHYMRSMLYVHHVQKLGFTLFLQAIKALRESRGIALLCFQTSALEGDEGSVSRPGRFLCPGKTRYTSYRRLGGPQGQSGQQKISPPPGFDPRTVQPAVSWYTDRATRPTPRTMKHVKLAKLKINNYTKMPTWISCAINVSNYPKLVSVRYCIFHCY